MDVLTVKYVKCKYFNFAYVNKFKCFKTQDVNKLMEKSNFTIIQ